MVETDFHKEVQAAILAKRPLPEWFPIAGQHAAAIGISIDGCPEGMYQRVIQGGYSFEVFQWVDWICADYVTEEGLQRAIITAVTNGRLDIIDYFAYTNEDLRFQGDKPIKIAAYWNKLHIVEYLLRYIKADNAARLQNGEEQVPFDLQTEIPWRRMFCHLFRKRNKRALKRLILTYPEYLVKSFVGS